MLASPSDSLLLTGLGSQAHKQQLPAFYVGLGICTQVPMLEQQELLNRAVFPSLRLSCLGLEVFFISAQCILISLCDPRPGCYT